MHRGMPYPVARAATNVLLRSLGTSLVMEEMYRGTPVIYIDYTDYDEIAHHSGPERAETLDALDGVDSDDRSLERGRAQDAAAVPVHRALGPRPEPRLDVHAALRQDAPGRHRGADGRRRTSVRAATEGVEEWGQLNAFLSEARAGQGRDRARSPGAMTGGRTKDGRRDRAARRNTPTPSDEAEREPPELVVCARGNLALIYFPRLAGSGLARDDRGDLAGDGRRARQPSGDRVADGPLRGRAARSPWARAACAS